MFLNRWSAVLLAMPGVGDSSSIEQLSLRQLRQPTVLQPDVSHYERQAAGHPDKTYAILVAAAKRYLEGEHMGKSRRELESPCASHDRP